MPGTRVVAIWNRTASRAEALAREFEADAVADLDALLANGRIDAVDITTAVGTHVEFALRVAASGKHVLCQKPLAASLEEAREIVDACHAAGVRLMVNENWRWRPWYRAARSILDAGEVGRPFYLRLASRSAMALATPEEGLPFQRQPFLRTLEPLILLELGPHYFDVARYLLGDLPGVFARTLKVVPRERVLGEEIATSLLFGRDRMAVIELSWASIGHGNPIQPDSMTIEGTEGTLHLSTDGTLRLSRADGTVQDIDLDIDNYYDRSWSRALKHFAECLADGSEFETSGDHHLGTLRLLFSAYESASNDGSVDSSEFG